MAKKPTQQERKREFLLKIARRAAKFLTASNNSTADMSWAERVLSEANLLNFDPKRSSPEIWTDQAIARNSDLMDQSMPYLLERDVRPDRAESFEVLILSLVPSEGGL
jgi:hypothetical protein